MGITWTKPNRQRIWSQNQKDRIAIHTKQSLSNVTDMNAGARLWKIRVNNLEYIKGRSMY